MVDIARQCILVSGLRAISAAGNLAPIFLSSSGEPSTFFGFRKDPFARFSNESAVQCETHRARCAARGPLRPCLLRLRWEDR